MNAEDKKAEQKAVSIQKNRLINNLIEPCLLMHLFNKRAHGYVLVAKAPEFDLSSGAPRTTYRKLRRREKEGTVISEWETSNSGPARRLYKLTDRGYYGLE